MASEFDDSCECENERRKLNFTANLVYKRESVTMLMMGDNCNNLCRVCYSIVQVESQWNRRQRKTKFTLVQFRCHRIELLQLNGNTIGRRDR